MALPTHVREAQENYQAGWSDLLEGVTSEEVLSRVDAKFQAGKQVFLHRDVWFEPETRFIPEELALSRNGKRVQYRQDVGYFASILPHLGIWTLPDGRELFWVLRDTKSGQLEFNLVAVGDVSSGGHLVGKASAKIRLTQYPLGVVTTIDKLSCVTLDEDHPKGGVHGSIQFPEDDPRPEYFASVVNAYFSQQIG